MYAVSLLPIYMYLQITLLFLMHILGKVYTPVPLLACVCVFV